MATNQITTATGGNPETLDHVLERIQRMYIPERFILVWEDWDWLVVLQCMQDHGLFQSNPKRPPFTAFEQWLEQNQVPQLLAHCSERNMRYVNKKIRGARYPWKDVTWEPHILKRWRVLYRTLDKMFTEFQDTTCVAKPMGTFYVIYIVNNRQSKRV